jgi:hypothetical protein
VKRPRTGNTGQDGSPAGTPVSAKGVKLSTLVTSELKVYVEPKRPGPCASGHCCVRVTKSWSARERV